MESVQTAGVKVVPVVPDQLAGRAWGAFNALGAGVLAVGSLVAPMLVSTLGLAEAMILTGALLTLIPVLAWRWLNRLNGLANGRAEDVGLLRRVPLFAALSQVSVERLAQGVRTEEVSAGQVIVRQSEPGALFYVLADGEAVVTRNGQDVRRLGPADSFGEIALLEPTARTATVTAAAPTRLLVLARGAFVTAVTGHLLTDDLARERLSSLHLADEERSTRDVGGRTAAGGD